MHVNVFLSEIIPFNINLKWNQNNKNRRYDIKA